MSHPVWQDGGMVHLVERGWVRVEGAELRLKMNFNHIWTRINADENGSGLTQRRRDAKMRSGKVRRMESKLKSATSDFLLSSVFVGFCRLRSAFIAFLEVWGGGYNAEQL